MPKKSSRNLILLDEIASRRDVYGAEQESQAWRIFDHNAEEIAEANFDIDKLVELRIPNL